MTESHEVRTAAEGFGADAERYDRTRPRYPDALVADLVAAMPGPRVLDVGCGTGIAARQLAAAGCLVLGVDVDARMVELARGLGAYDGILDRAAAGLATAPFGEPRRATYPWERRYTREEWLEQVPTFGGFSSMPAQTQQALLAGMGDAVAAVGGAFTMSYTAVALTALRQSA